MAAVSSLRETYNTEFVANEIMECQDFFDNIEGRKLDNQQRKAIVTDEDNNLIVAGAGSYHHTTMMDLGYDGRGVWVRARPTAARERYGQAHVPRLWR